MGITPDGDRSMKRLWFARKMLAKIRDIGVSSKSLIWAGFKFIVTDIDGDLATGRVMAPMGAVVACAGPSSTGAFNRVYLMAADYWAGGFTPTGYAKTMRHTTVPWTNYLHDYTQAELEGFGYSTEEWRQLTTRSLYPPSHPDPADTDHLYDDEGPTPVVLPYKGGEAYWLLLNGLIWFDSDGDGVLDAGEYKTLTEGFVNFYNSDGASMEQRRSFFSETALVDYIFRIYQVMPSSGLAVVTFHTNVTYSTASSKRRLAVHYRIPADGTLVQNYWYANDDWVSLPAGLYSIVTSLSGTVSVKPLGLYAFATAVDGAPTLLSCTDLTATGWTGGPYLDQAWFTANPGNDEWKLFYTMRKVGGALTTVSSAQFINLLDTLCDTDIIHPSTGAIDWSLARLMMYQFFPSPNQNWRVPHDSVMFHGTDGTVYTWTRKYAGVAFTDTGMFAQAMTMPAKTVATNGVRPSTYYCGQFSAADLYLCVCETMALTGPITPSPTPVVPRTVSGVYYGSPFGSWTELPVPETGFHLVNVRPVYVNIDAAGAVAIHLLGVFEDETDPGFHLAFCRYSAGSLHGAGTGGWHKLGRLPVDYNTRYTWGVGVFGEGAMVQQQAEFLHQPAALCQMPVGPYTEYEQP